MNNILHNSVLPEIEFIYVERYYNLRAGDVFVVPFPRTNTVKANFYYQMIILWNELPPRIRTIHNVGSLNNVTCFKREFKQYLLDNM